MVRSLYKSEVFNDYEGELVGNHDYVDTIIIAVFMIVFLVSVVLFIGV